MNCPNCNSPNTYIVHDTTTSGSNVNVCNGILGYLCLGPIGLLCLLVGGNKKTTTRPYLVCNNCHIRTRV